ncbi:transmembrane protease serine 5-like [Tyto alba]|uniref:transmembrane protease serine 5-like n=1 Tax=Tyto alba TaxID=56313 RepID=UPI001C674568|nr:transmembrane protease serine 5-like [Tyto alba]
MSPASAEQFPDNPLRVEDAMQSHNSPRAEPRREARRTQASPGHDSANASLKTVCTIRRLFLLLGAAGLLAGTAAGAWLLVKHLKKPQPDQGFSPLQEPDAVPACSDGEEEDPVVRGAPSRGLHLCLLPQRMGRGVCSAGQCLPSPARTEKMLFSNKYVLVTLYLLSAAFCDCFT